MLTQIRKDSRIGIVGAGISGIALAILLKLKGFSNIHIFEKDKSFESRKQGYGLTILQGKTTLKQLGILQQAKKQNAPSKAHYIFNNQGKILGFYGTLFWDNYNNNRSQKSSQKGLSMHIPRQSLRKLLINRFQEISPGSIKWDHSLKSWSSDQSSVTLQFQNNYQSPVDLVVGCDGIYSLVRAQCVQKQQSLNYLGIMVVLGLCGSNHALTKQRVFQSADGSFRLFSMPFIPNNPNLSCMWQLSFPIDLNTANLYSKNSALLKEFIFQKLKSWHQPIPSMISGTQLQNLMGIPAFDRQPIPPNIKDEKFILLGDALHPMSPFKGQGANQALLDATYLSQLLQTLPFLNTGDLHRDLSERASKKVIQSRLRVEKYHSVSYLDVNNFIYPRIDSKLIDYLEQAGITSSSAQIQSQILSIMRRYNYV